jgi:DNA-binding transcriptional LysR family regulator
LQYILHNGGSGYFPLRLVQSHLEARRLKLVQGAPEFSIPAYAVYPSDREPDVCDRAIGLMHLATADAAKTRSRVPIRRVK